MSYRENDIDQQLDVRGSLIQTDALLPLTDESSQLGAAKAGQTGTAASITAGATVTLTGLTGMTIESEGSFIEITGATNPGNNGTFLVSNYISATSVEIINSSAVTEGTGFEWTERQPYSLEDNLNYVRTDRAAIKGVGYDQPIPTYTRCTDTVTPVDANLLNIAGKTTDAKSFVFNRKFENIGINPSDGYVTLNDPGNLKHANSVDTTGVPVADGFDAGNDEATYVEIVDGYSAALTVLSGPNAGNRIYGQTVANTSTSPNSVDVQLRSVPDGEPLSSSVPYSWEADQPNSVDMFYGYRECLDTVSETALRVTLVNGIIGDAGVRQNILDLQTTVGVTDGDTDLAGKLTNTTDYFPFSDLPDATPSVVEALNTLNEQIGDRTYSGPVIGDNDGYSITDTLQNLADAIGETSGVQRAITRAGSSFPVGSVITLPGGLSYTTDSSDQGTGLMVWWRGVLRDPGTIANGDDYEETSSTSITNLRLIRANDHINWLVIG
jgi:hypothetical protein